MPEEVGQLGEPDTHLQRRQCHLAAHESEGGLAHESEGGFEWLPLQPVLVPYSRIRMRHSRCGRSLSVLAGTSVSPSAAAWAMASSAVRSPLAVLLICAFSATASLSAASPASSVMSNSSSAAACERLCRRCPARQGVEVSKRRQTVETRLATQRRSFTAFTRSRICRGWWSTVRSSAVLENPRVGDD